MRRLTNPCGNFRIARNSKFCNVCGHTAGRHPLIEADPAEYKYGYAPATAPAFEVVGEFTLEEGRTDD